MSVTRRVGFAGTPEFAATVLQALVQSHQELVVVYTQPDRKGGRGRRVIASPVKHLSVDHQLPLRQPANLRDDAEAEFLARCNLDVLVVAAYGLILPERLLTIPAHGCINVHASLLPRWRGAAPVERAIMAGDSQTGISIMQMDAGLDTGPVLAQATCPIGEDTRGPELEAQLARLGAGCLMDCLDNLESLVPEPQAETGACYAPKLTSADARIDWTRSARHIHRQVRALCGRMPATTSIGDVAIRILDARCLEGPTPVPPGVIAAANRDGITVGCGEGSLIIQRLQLNRGKGRPLAAADAVNGYPTIFTTGSSLADRP